MRLTPIVFLSVSLALPGLAHAQSTTVKGASLAGLCAASLEFVAGSRNSAGTAQPQELAVLQRVRDLYLMTPAYSRPEVEGYANAWTRRMAEDLTQATDDAGRGAVVTHVGKIAQNCMRKMSEQFRAGQQSGAVSPAPQPTVPQPVPAQPLEVQPLIINPQ